MNKNKKLGFTLAEVLIVIGIIGVVAALTLPNLNHATGDKETVTRLQKAYSILNEANDRAVAIYGPISTWASNEQCADDLQFCWLTRVSEFLKVSNFCNESGVEYLGESISCDNLRGGLGDYNGVDMVYQLSDGITISNSGTDFWKNCSFRGWFGTLNDICVSIYVDINGPNKGQNKAGRDIFEFSVSDSIGVTYNRPRPNEEEMEGGVQTCSGTGATPQECTWWVLDFGNLDYLKTTDGECNDSDIILNGTTNTSCH